MKELKELKEVYGNVFEDWMSDWDIKQELDRRWTSRESWYLDGNGIGIQDVTRAKKRTVDENTDVCQGYFNLNIEGDEIKVYLEIWLEDFDEEEQMYLEESSEIIGWE